MSWSKPLIQRLDSPRKMYPHLKWQRSALTLSKHTEEVNELSPTKLDQPVRSSQLSLLQRLNSPKSSSMIPSEPILACSNSMTDLSQTHGTVKERESLKRKRISPLDPNGQHPQGRQMQRG